MYAGEEKVMAHLADKKPHSLEEISQSTRLNPDSIRRILEDLRGRGFVLLERRGAILLSPSPELESYARHPSDLPEYKVLEAAQKGTPIAALPADLKPVGLPWAKKKGFISIESGKLIPLKSLTDALSELRGIQTLYEQIRSGSDKIDPVLLGEPLSRKWVAKKTGQTLMATASGQPYVAAAGFDIAAPAQDAPLGKAHPLGQLTDKIKAIFVEMGFEEEMDGDLVQSAFWNFDALFQPQDHPARDLADTFYVKGEAELPAPPLVSRVKRAHEQSWKYKWSETEARRRVLRTHTTSISARTLASLPDGRPRKYFTVGKVFRNEATDFKHLTEFYQVEGIVAWEKATFSDLLGILREFYRRLGFEKIRFRPSFFPYTEPSLEVEVYFDLRREWMELGGAGIFRPEVSMPLCNRYPVLAWGLSLERPLLLTLDLKDIRVLYRNEMDFLKEVRMPL